MRTKPEYLRRELINQLGALGNHLDSLILSRHLISRRRKSVQEEAVSILSITYINEQIDEKVKRMGEVIDSLRKLDNENISP